MGTLRLFFAGLLVMGMGALAQQGTKPVKDIDIIIKKQPSGSATLVRTDANGGFSVRIPEAGTYTLRFAAPPELPGLPGTVRSTVKFLADNPAAAEFSVRKPSPGRRFAVKGGISQVRLTPTGPSGLYNYETLEFSGPGVFTGQMSADRSLTSVAALSFVAVEGQLSPLPQTVDVIAEGYPSFEYNAALRPDLERRWSVALEGDRGTGLATGNKPQLRVAVNTDGLPAGTYADEIVLTLRSGEQTEPVRLPIAIHVRPRGTDLGILTDRTTYVITQRTGTVRTLIRLTNQTTSEEVYTFEHENESDRAGFVLPAEPIRIPSGQTVEVPIIVDADQVASKKVCCVKSLSNIKPFPKRLTFAAPPTPTDPASTPCVATGLVPILINRPNNILRGVSANLEYEVWDDCGTQRTDYTVQAISKLGGSASGKAVNKPGVSGLLTIPTSGPDQLQVEVRAGELTGEDTYDLEVETTPVPAMKAINKGGIGSLRAEPASNQSIAPGAIVEAETTPISEAGELLFGRTPIRVLSRQGNVLTFRVPYNTDPTVPQILQVRDGNHTSAAFPLPVAPAVPVILRNAETGAYTFLRGDDGSLTPITAETRAPAGSTLVLFAEGLGSVETEPTAETPTVILTSANRKLRAGINDGVKGGTVGLGKTPPGKIVMATEIALTRDLPIELEGRPEAAFRLTFTLPEGLESADPASGLVNLWVESQGVPSELAGTYTPDPAPLTSVTVTSRAIPFPATHLWDGVSQTGPRTANEAIGQARTLEGPTPQNLAPGVRLRLADLVSNTANATAPSVNKWDIVVPNSASPVDYTAIYEKEFQLTFVVNPPACGTLSTGALSSPGNWWPEGSTVPLSRTVNAGWTVVSILGGTTSSSTLMDRPRTVTMTCQQGFPVTLRVNPLAPVSVRINNNTSATGSVTSITSVASTLTVPNDFVQGSNYYFFFNTSTPALTWTQQPGPNTWSATAPAPTAAVTYTVTYNVGCVILPPHPNMTISGGILATQPGVPANCYLGNLTLTATPPPGQCFTSWDDGNTTNPRVWGVAVSAVLPRPLFAPCTPGNTCVSAPPGPGGWWSFETPSGPVLDRMPLGLNGIRRGNPVPIPGKVGNALQFDGASSVEVPYNAIFDTPVSAGAQGNFTLDAWVRIDPNLAAPGGQLAGVRHVAAPYQAWAWGVGKNGVGFYAENVANTNAYEAWSTSGLSINDNNWHFIAVRFVRDPVTGFGNITFWLDGAKQTVSTGMKVNDLSATNRSLFIGFNGYTGAAGQHFVGGIDEFEYFQRALADTEVEGIYKAGDKGKCPPAPTGVRITVNGNPAAVGAVAGAAFGATGLGAPSAPTFTTVLPTGTTSLAVTAATPVTNTAAGIRYELTNWSVNGTANPAWTATPQAVPVPTANTTYTANYRTLFEVKVVVNGTCTVSPTPGFYPARTQLPVVINPATGPTATWAFDGGSLSVVSGGRILLLSPGTLTVNCSASTGVPISVITNPASIGAMVGVDTVGSNTDSYGTSLPAGSSQTLTAQDPVIHAGTLYRFDTWSPAGPQITVPATGPAVYTANYRLRGYVVTLTGCGATIGPMSLAVQTNPLVFAPNVDLQIFPNPPAGQTFTSFTITMGGTTTTQTTNPGRITLTGPATIVANCGTPTTVPVTVLTNPANIGATVGLAGLNPGAGSNLNQYSTNAVPGATGTVSAAPVQLFNGANTTRWDFKNWTGAGVVAPGTSNPQPVAIQPNGSTFVANYDTFFKVDVVNNGCASVSPVAGFYPAGSTLTVTVVPGNNNQLGSLNFGTPQGGATLPPIANNSTVTIDRYKVVEATCGTTPVGNVTVNTNPANLGVTVGVTGSGSAPNSFTATNLPAGPVAVTVSTLGPVLTQQGIQYELELWRQGNSILGSALSQPGTVTAGVTTTYTAQYRITGNRVTIVNNGCTSVGTTPAVPANGIWPVNTNMTGLSATPPAGGTLTNVVAAVFDPSSGQTVNLTFNTLPISNPLPINTPWTITFNCAAATNVGVTVNTAPANLGATVGIGAASGVNTVSATLPAGSAQTLSASPTALVASTGLGYRFNNWTPAGPAVTLPASGTVTYTANYTVACFLVLTEVQPAGSGTITLSPASPANLPANCYPNGTAITATIVPAAGRLAGSIQPGAAGTGGQSPYSFTITGPTLLVGTTTAAPAPAPNVNWAFVSRNGLTAVFRATNTGNLPLTNLRITALTPIRGMQYTNRPPLPIPVGTLAPGASANVTLPFEFIGESLEPNLNAAFQVALTSQADNLPAANFNIQVPPPR